MQKYNLLVVLTILFPTLAGEAKAADAVTEMAKNYIQSIELVKKNAAVMSAQAPACGFVAKIVAARVNKNISGLDQQKQFILTYPSKVNTKLNAPVDLSKVTATKGAPLALIADELKKATIADLAATDVNKSIFYPTVEINKTIEENKETIEKSIQTKTCPKIVFTKYTETKSALLNMQKIASSLKTYYKTRGDSLRSDAYARAEQSKIKIAEAEKLVANFY